MFATAFVLWGAAVTWLEIAAFALALGCVVLNVLEIHWGWGLAIASSLLYGGLFLEYRLYGEAGLQAFFAAVAVWGWWQWLRGSRGGGGGGFAGRESRDGRGLERPGGEPTPLGRAPGPRLERRLDIAVLGIAERWRVLLAWALGWPLLALLLDRATDTDVPWFDAFPTVGSVIGQVLLGRKYLENWPVWVLVNLVSVALFAFKGLWLTALLYAVFVALALLGWLRWHRIAYAQARA